MSAGIAAERLAQRRCDNAGRGDAAGCVGSVTPVAWSAAPAHPGGLLLVTAAWPPAVPEDLLSGPRAFHWQRLTPGLISILRAQLGCCVSVQISQVQSRQGRRGPLRTTAHSVTPSGDLAAPVPARICIRAMFQLEQMHEDLDNETFNFLQGVV